MGNVAVLFAPTIMKGHDACVVMGELVVTCTLTVMRRRATPLRMKDFAVTIRLTSALALAFALALALMLTGCAGLKSGDPAAIPQAGRTESHAIANPTGQSKS